MFRALAGGVPPDPYFEPNLEKLGFYFTTDGLLRRVDDPNKKFNFFFTNDEVTNTRRREAIRRCTQSQIVFNLSRFGVRLLHLPGLQRTPPNSPHVPILMTPPETLRRLKRVILFVNDTNQDLGVLSVRMLHGDMGINGGSVIGLVKEMIDRSSRELKTPHADRSPSDITQNWSNASSEPVHSETLKDNQNRASPGVVILNSGQRFYSYQENDVMTYISWNDRHRASRAHDRYEAETALNSVKQHEDPQNHIKTTFDILFNDGMISEEADVFVIAIGGGADATLRVLDREWSKYRCRLRAMALISPTIVPSDLTDSELLLFIHARGRCWILSNQPGNEFMSSPPSSLFDSSDFNGHSREDGVLHSQSDSRISVDWTESLPTRAKHIPFLNSPRSTPSTQLETQGSPIPQHPRESIPDSEEGNMIGNHSSNSDIFHENVEYPTEEPLCPTFSGGEESFTECIFPKVYKHVLDYFEEIAVQEHFLGFSDTWRVPSDMSEKFSTLSAETSVPTLDRFQISEQHEAGNLSLWSSSEENSDMVMFGGAAIERNLLTRAGFEHIAQRRPLIGKVRGSVGLPRIHESDAEEQEGEHDEGN